MADRQIKIPGPDHPISIAPCEGRVIVRIGGKPIADTVEALTLLEANYPPIHYIPRKDVLMAELQRSETSTYCPFKGDASYYSIPAGGERSIDAVWTYEHPYDAVAGIKDHLAFYSTRVDAIELAKG